MRSMILPIQTTLILTYSRYDFEYEDDGEEENGDVDIENKYYSAKQMREDNPEEAIEEFLGVPALEQEKGDWGFKGLKQAIKLEFKMARYDQVSRTPRISLSTADEWHRQSSTTRSFLHTSNRQ